MPDQMWNYVYKIMDALTSFRTLAVAGAVILLTLRERIGLDAETVKYITVALVGWVISDAQRPTSRPASEAMAKMESTPPTVPAAVVIAPTQQSPERRGT